MGAERVTRCWNGGTPAEAPRPRAPGTQRPAIAAAGTVELCRSCAAITIRPMPRSTVNLTRHFLIAMPAMVDPNFAHTLTYVCEHNPEGALGIVVNRPTDMTLQTLFEQIDIPLGGKGSGEARVHFGGPVQVDRGFVLH